MRGLESNSPFSPVIYPVSLQYRTKLTRLDNGEVVERKGIRSGRWNFYVVLSRGLFIMDLCPVIIMSSSCALELQSLTYTYSVSIYLQENMLDHSLILSKCVIICSSLWLMIKTQPQDSSAVG